MVQGGLKGWPMAGLQALMFPLRLGFGKVGVFTVCNSRSKRREARKIQRSIRTAKKIQ